MKLHFFRPLILPLWPAVCRSGKYPQPVQSGPHLHHACSEFKTIKATEQLKARRRINYDAKLAAGLFAKPPLPTILEIFLEKTKKLTD